MSALTPPAALLFDYGQVISLAPSTGAVTPIIELLGLDPEVFDERYWRYRNAYDRGAAASSYWSAVAGRALSDDEIRTLSELDLASWSELNDDTLAVLAEARARGIPMSLLSNAPYDLAASLSEHPALAGFEHRLFSSRLGLVKPDLAAYAAALDRMGRRGEDVLFIDDREANVDAAMRAGLRAVRFTTAARLRADVFGAG